MIIKNRLALKMSLYILTGVFSVFLFIIIIIISGNITTPLEKLAGAAREIGTGNFDIKLPENHSKDEIGQLSDSFLMMQAQLKEYVRNLKEETAVREKFENELKIAHDIQQGIIPKTFPAFPQRNDVDLYGDERLMAILIDPGHGLVVNEITQCILDDMAGFTKNAEQSDDITILVLSYSGK